MKYTHAQIIYTVKPIEKLGFIMHAVIRCDGNGCKQLKVCWSAGSAWTIVNRFRIAQTVAKYKRAA